VRTRDGVAMFRAALLVRGLATEAHLDAIDRECRAEVDSAVAEGVRLGLDLTEPAPYDEATALALAYGA
jgi:TPP-dependent pyruvate/acetoin dehydrogenase alpha subunit